MLISLSVDEMLLSRYLNWSTYFRGLPLKETAPSCLKAVQKEFGRVRVSVFPRSVRTSAQTGFVIVLCKTPVTMSKKVGIAITCLNHCFHDLVKHHYTCYSFFEETIHL